jgi:uncharacterized protein YjiS (DUF1127 family)
MLRQPRLMKQSNQDTAQMGTIHRITELGPATARRQVYSPLETYRNAFREWRKRERLRTELRLLTDSELTDIGITRGEIDYVTSNDLSTRPVFVYSEKIGDRSTH